MPGGQMNWSRVKTENMVRTRRDADPDRVPRLKGHGCWCGEALGHPWPGKSEGAPHPRD